MKPSLEIGTIRKLASVRTLKNIIISFILLLSILGACSEQSKEKASITVKKQSQETNIQRKVITEDDTLPEVAKSADVSQDNSKKPPANIQIRDLGNGFHDHGVAVPFATSRGTVAMVDQKGHKLILIWLYDHRGTYSLLLIDTESKKSKQFSLPFRGPSYSSILASNNHFYIHFQGRFVEFDPDKRDFTFIGKTSARAAMSMTEDDEGVIWAATMPNCKLISFNPKTKKLKEYGTINKNKARQRPRSIAVDDKGWVYVTAGPPGKAKVVAFDPKTKKTTKLTKNKASNLSLISSQNGKVFAKADDGPTMELYAGKKKTPKNNIVNPKSYITANQALFHRTFPDGTRIMDYVSSSSTGFLGAREVTIKNKKTGKAETIAFDYETEGALVMEVASSPNGKIVGGSTFPMFFFRYDPNTGEWNRQKAYGQTNTIETINGQIFLGSYNYGALLEWNPRKKWIQARKEKKGTNPQYLIEATPYISRPHDLLAYPDQQTVILAGRPAKNKSTGGLLFWDRNTEEADLLKQVDGLPNQSTHSLVALPDGKILGGTTIKPGDTGGRRLAKEATLYIMDIRSKKVDWLGAIISNAVSYDDLAIAPNGLVMGVADRQHFFIFDPNRHKKIKQINLKEGFGSRIPYTQGQRSFVQSPEGDTYLLLQNGILKVDPINYRLILLAKAPQKITGGGAYLNSRIYYTGGGRNRIHSFKISEN